MVFGLSFKVIEWEPNKEEDIMEVTDTSYSHGNNDNPIVIKDYPYQNLFRQAK